MRRTMFPISSRLATASSLAGSPVFEGDGDEHPGRLGLHTADDLDRRAQGRSYAAFFCAFGLGLFGESAWSALTTGRLAGM